MHLLAIRLNQLPDLKQPAAPEIDDVLTSTQALYQERGYQEPWICYLGIEQDQVIGTCGFTGPPKSDEVEIAYFCFPAFQGRGLATLMATALVLIHRAAAPRDCRLIAYTLPEPGASTRILGKLGFVCLGDIIHPEDGRIWKWRLESPPGAR